LNDLQTSTHGQHLTALDIMKSVTDDDIIDLNKSIDTPISDLISDQINVIIETKNDKHEMINLNAIISQGALFSTDTTLGTLIKRSEQPLTGTPPYVPPECPMYTVVRLLHSSPTNTVLVVAKNESRAPEDIETDES